jgi:hypothetical protein
MSNAKEPLAPAKLPIIMTQKALSQDHENFGNRTNHIRKIKRENAIKNTLVTISILPLDPSNIKERPKDPMIAIAVDRMIG